MKKHTIFTKDKYKSLLFLRIQDESFYPKMKGYILKIFIISCFESSLLPCTFVKIDTFNVTVKAIIPVEFSVKCQVEQEDLIIMDEGSYQQILSLQKERGPFLLQWKNAIKWRKMKGVKKAMLGLKKLSFLVWTDASVLRDHQRTKKVSELSEVEIINLL